MVEMRSQGGPDARRRGLPLVLSLLLCVALAGPAQARTAPPGLYEAVVGVVGESVDERDVALRRGLSQVLMRLIAQPVADRQVRLAPLLEQSGNYMRQFGYQRDTEGQLQLRIQFDGPLLVRALHAAGLPVWLEADRPRVLIWLVIDRDDERVVVGGGDQPEAQALIRGLAAQFGLPVVLPLLDLEDRRALQPSDLWGGFRSPVLAASARYGTDVVLLGRVVEHVGGLHTRWLLYAGDLSEEWSGTARALPELLRGGLQSTTQRLAARLSRLPGEQVFHTVWLSVEGVRGVEDYAYIRRRIALVRGVQDVDVELLAGERLVLRVQSERDARLLLADLGRSTRLELDGARALPAATDGERIAMRLRE
jgi:uncharacterized protein